MTGRGLRRDEADRLGRGDRTLVQAQHRLDRARDIGRGGQAARAGAQGPGRVIVHRQLRAERPLRLADGTFQLDEPPVGIALDHPQALAGRELSHRRHLRAQRLGSRLNQDLSTGQAHGRRRVGRRDRRVLEIDADLGQGVWIDGTDRTEVGRSALCAGQDHTL